MYTVRSNLDHARFFFLIWGSSVQFASNCERFFSDSGPGTSRPRNPGTGTPSILLLIPGTGMGPGSSYCVPPFGVQPLGVQPLGVQYCTSRGIRDILQRFLRRKEQIFLERPRMCFAGEVFGTQYCIDTVLMQWQPFEMLGVSCIR